MSGAAKHILPPPGRDGVEKNKRQGSAEFETQTIALTPTYDKLTIQGHGKIATSLAGATMVPSG